MLDQLRQLIGPDVQGGVALAPFTTFKIGGPAEYYFEAKDADAVMKAVAAATELGLSYFVIGGGSNMVVADDGIKGLVIRITAQGLTIDGTNVTAMAGMASGLVSMKAADAGLTGLEWMVGLPGTIGGAVRGNAGMFGGEVRDNLVSAQVLRDGKVVTMTNAECAFAYRESVFKHESHWVVLSATYGLALASDKDASKAQLRANLLKKKEQQPIEHPTAGCVFVNWKPEKPEDVESLRKTLDLDKDEVIPVTKAGAVPAAWIIDRAQLKGMTIGHISISEKHANFFINDGKGTSDEVVQLIAVIKTKVRNMTGAVVNLQEEVEYFGY
jgi:UDP-N-acetylmuramate dehydrogenase